MLSHQTYLNSMTLLGHTVISDPHVAPPLFSRRHDEYKYRRLALERCLCILHRDSSKIYTTFALSICQTKRIPYSRRSRTPRPSTGAWARADCEFLYRFWVLCHLATQHGNPGFWTKKHRFHYSKRPTTRVSHLGILLTSIAMA